MKEGEAEIENRGIAMLHCRHSVFNVAEMK